MSNSRPRPPVGTLLFDLDGTVLDTIDLILASYEHVHRREFPEEPFDPEYYRSRVGVPLRGVFAERVGEDPERISALIDLYRGHNLAEHDARVTSFEGVPGMLDAARARGVRTAIVTSKMRETTERGLRLVGLLEHFEVMVTIDDVVHHKPHPEPVIRALSLLKVGPEDALFVGDAPADIGCGRAAGVRTGAALWGPFHREELLPHGPDHLIEHPAQILELLGEA